MQFLLRIITILTIASLPMARPSVLANATKKVSVGPASKGRGTPPTRKVAVQEDSIIIVNERELVGPNSSPQTRGGRLFLPIATIARVLGDTLSSDPTTRVVSVRRQDGTAAVFNAQLNEVRENGAVILSVSGTADLIFAPTSNDLMLPAEIVAALLDVIVRRDQSRAILITRKALQPDTIRPGAKHAPWEIFQIEYEYNFNRYSSSSDHSLVLRGVGRVGDAMLSFMANSSIDFTNRSRPDLQGGNIRLDRPNGQTFVAGEFGTGTDVEFLAAAVRGGLVQLPLNNVRLDIFGGQTASGTLPTPTLDPISNPDNLGLTHYSPFTTRYDTQIFGAIATTATQRLRQPDFTFSAGALHFGGEQRKGNMLAGGARYNSGFNRFQADVAMGQFSGVNRDGTRTTGTDAAIGLTGSYRLTEQIIVQGRYAYVGPRFLGPQGGLHEPTNLAAAGVSWQPKSWLTAAVSGSNATTPGRLGQFNRYITATVNLSPDNSLPSLFISHTQTSTTQLRDSAFTLITATKKFNRWQMFLNASRVKTFGTTSLNAQVGGNIRINESNSLQVSQSLGSRGLFSGMTTWQVSNLFHNRLGLSGGLGYTRSNTDSFHTSAHLTTSVKLPRETSLQFSYLRTQTGNTALLSLHGLFFSSRRAERAINGPIAELNSYGAVYGRVYQDVNLNGRYDPDTDLPQANVKVQVDGSRYVVSDVAGNYRIDNVTGGAHAVYLDLLSVRADLTLLDNTHQQITLESRRDSVVDFRVVRTGRITGVVWFDANENGRQDEGEYPLADIRIVTGSGRDTLTDDKGYFLIGDLPPGEHILLLDEKTLPEQTRSVTRSQTLIVSAGNETVTVLPVAKIPDQIKKFPR